MVISTRGARSKILHSGEHERGLGDLADTIGAGSDSLECSPPTAEDREAAFAEAAGGSDRHLTTRVAPLLADSEALAGRAGCSYVLSRGRSLVVVSSSALMVMDRSGCLNPAARAFGVFRVDPPAAVDEAAGTTRTGRL